MREIPALIYTQIDLDVARRTTEDALHAMRFAEQRAQKTSEKADAAAGAAEKARGVAIKAQNELDEKRLAAAAALRVEKELFDARGSRKGQPFAQTWASRLEELGISDKVARNLLELSGYKGQSSALNPSRADDSSADSAGSNPDPSSATQSGGSANSRAPASGEPTREPPADRSGGRGKPEWLMRALVRDYSMPSDLVCDPLAGWGSTLRAALNEGRRAVGAELDPKIAAEAGELPIAVGRWQESLAHLDAVDAIICDPPYSARTHEASRKFGNAREDGSSLEGLGPDYAAWTRDHVFEFVRSWAPRNRGWFVALTDHNLIHHWQDAYEEAGLYSFAPVICLIRGMTVRLCGDGPSSWAIYAMVARPLTFSRWRTLTGGYVGSRDRLEIGDAA